MHSLTTSFHASAGGIWKAVEHSTEMGGSSFALFLGSQRSWKRPALDQEAAAKFQEQLALQGYNPAHVLPHGSYLMNCGSPKPGLWPMKGLSSPNAILSFSSLLVYLYLCSSTLYSLLLTLTEVFEKSQALLVDELNRCNLLGLNLYNFHPGSSLGSITTEQCVDKIAEAINHAHQQTPAVVTGSIYCTSATQSNSRL